MILLWPFRPPQFLRMPSALVSAVTTFILALFFAPNDLVAVNHSPVITLFVNSSSLPAPQSPHAFPLSESELRDLAQALAPKVDLFQAVWEKDPKAEFFAGTTRDYLYWILGHFKGLANSDIYYAPDRKTKRQKIAEIKAKLLAIPFIKFNEIVGPESDADIMTKNREALSSLRAEDFAIRKLDFISFDRAIPGQPMYQDEINQGFIPCEKIRLSKKGISTDPNFGNGVSDLVTGNLSIHFPDREQFWKTHYAQLGANHPLLLALRYVRILSQDYLQRHGSEIPDARKLEVPMTKEIKSKIKALIQEAIADADRSFNKFFKNMQGKKWLNASIQKSFRSFTNANAAFELMKELGLLGLIEIYPNEIESVHQYLLKTKRDETEIAKNFKKFGITPNDLYEKIADYLPDLELYHGTASELAFRNIIYQGVIPSESGSAGRGLYGVSKKDLEFAKNWSERRSEQDDLVIALKLKPSTKIVDITQGKGKELFEKWGLAQDGKDNESAEDAFAEAFGIDLIRYPYGNTEAFVLKNADQICSRRGVFKNPRPIQELFSSAEKARDKNDFHFLKDLLETPLTKDERKKIISILGKSYFKRALTHQHFTDLKQILNRKIISLVDALLHSSLTNLHPLIWGLIPSLLKDPNLSVRWDMAEALQKQTTWPASLWNEVPNLLKDSNKDVRSLMALILTEKTDWPPEVWHLVPALMKDQIVSVQANIASAIQTQNSWPDSFWNEVPALLKDPNDMARLALTQALENRSSWPDPVWNEVPALLIDRHNDVRFNIASALQTQNSWPDRVWNEVPTLLKDPNDMVRLALTQALKNRSSWPDPVWNEVPALLKDQCDSVRANMVSALQTQNSWSDRVWNEVPTLLKDPINYVQMSMTRALKNRSSWPQEVIDLVSKSHDPRLQDLKKLKPTVLDLSTCKKGLREVHEPGDRKAKKSSHPKVMP